MFFLIDDVFKFLWIYCKIIFFLIYNIIKVGFVDILRLMGIILDGIVGYFVGELGCGYVDGFLIVEEIVFVVYWRGRCIREFNFLLGGMVVVGKWIIVMVYFFKLGFWFIFFILWGEELIRYFCYEKKMFMIGY